MIHQIRFDMCIVLLSKDSSDTVDTWISDGAEVLDIKGTGIEVFDELVVFHFA